MTLALVGMVTIVRYKCRGEGRCMGATPAEDAEGAALAKAQAAQVDDDIRAVRDWGQDRDASARASETAQLRALLDDRADRDQRIDTN